MDYADIFLFNYTIDLLENTSMNKYAIKFIEAKQPSYGPIYSQELVELEILKTYIETHLKTGFIQLFKSPAGIPILFYQKSDRSLCLCVNYQGLNNLTINNWCPLLLIGETLDRQGQAKHFTQLDLTITYYSIRIQKENK